MAPPLAVFPLMNVIFMRLTVNPDAMVNIFPVSWALIIVLV